MQIAAVIVAAGRGERLRSALPKQYCRLGGRTVLARAVEGLLGEPAITRLQVVIHPDDAGRYRAALDHLEDARLLPPVAGGDSRSASVLEGLRALEPFKPDRVLIHDAARPLVPGSVIASVIAALDVAPAALPVLPVVDALWRVADGAADAALPRSGMFRAQTPQGFHFGPILNAHRTRSATAEDDAAVARAAGLAIRVVSGSEDSFKITTAEDLARARAMMEQTMDIRTGNGFDVHGFGQGDQVMLCGVGIPFERGLEGHSDADVGLHALTDAIIGALAEGDIGQWFPPSDPQWKGVSSRIFLEKAVGRASERGFAITHLDCTLVCEAPRIGPHAGAMRAALARITGLETDRISVKATTSERLGFTGRGEGIAALATATLVRA